MQDGLPCRYGRNIAPRDLPTVGYAIPIVQSPSFRPLRSPPATQQAEARRVKATGKQIEKQNNRPAVDIEVREFDITHSSFSYTDKTKDPNYRLFFSDTDIALKNLSNHQQQGPADLTLHRKFMGTGANRVSGDFLASQHGPSFTVKGAIQNTDLPCRNDIPRAYGRFHVAAGQ